jgi:hypothetical protein
MNWGAVAELVGALAVIVTIAYLAVQIRQNNKLVASSIAGSIRDALKRNNPDHCERPRGRTDLLGWH